MREVKWIQMRWMQQIQMSNPLCSGRNLATVPLIRYPSACNQTFGPVNWPMQSSGQTMLINCWANSNDESLKFSGAVRYCFANRPLSVRVINSFKMFYVSKKLHMSSAKMRRPHAQKWKVHSLYPLDGVNLQYLQTIDAYRTILNYSANQRESECKTHSTCGNRLW